MVRLLEYFEVWDQMPCRFARLLGFGLESYLEIFMVVDSGETMMVVTRPRRKDRL